jgi:vacuolar-type H+-ATPase subunit I/STV1
MPYLNRKGEVIVQRSVWITEDLDKLVKADHLNLSEFVREQLEEMYSDQSVVSRLNEKFRLMHKAKETSTRQRALVKEEKDTRDRLLENVRKKRGDRAAVVEQESEHQQNLIDAWDTLVESERIYPDQVFNWLPDNDPHGDRFDRLEDLTRDLSRVNGDEFTITEVITFVKQRCN